MVEVLSEGLGAGELQIMADGVRRRICCFAELRVGGLESVSFRVVFSRWCILWMKALKLELRK